MDMLLKQKSISGGWILGREGNTPIVSLEIFKCHILIYIAQGQGFYRAIMVETAKNGAEEHVELQKLLLLLVFPFRKILLMVASADAFWRGVRPSLLLTVKNTFFFPFYTSRITSSIKGTGAKACALLMSRCEGRQEGQTRREVGIQSAHTRANYLTKVSRVWCF